MNLTTMNLACLEIEIDIILFIFPGARVPPLEVRRGVQEERRLGRAGGQDGPDPVREPGGARQRAEDRREAQGGRNQGKGKSK